MLLVNISVPSLMEGTLDTYYVYLMCLFASFVYAVLGMTNYEIILFNIYIEPQKIHIKVKNVINIKNNCPTLQ